MRIRILLFLLLLISSTVFAQHNINFEFKLNYKTNYPNGGYLENWTNVDSGSFKEGESYLIPEETFDGVLASINPAYDAIEGGVFKIENGAIDEDIYIEIILSGLITNTGLYEKTYDEPLFLKLELVVRKEKDGAPVEGNYYFNSGKYLTLTINKGVKFRTFTADSVGLDIDSLGFAYIETGGFNGTGIETIDNGDSISFKAEHMSKFGGGKGTLRIKTVVDVKNERINSPASWFNLKQNYPNPFNPSTYIEYSIPESGYTELNIYNVLGECIETIVSGNIPAGNYKAVFSSDKFSSGIYFYELKWNNLRQVRKMILMK